MVDGIRALTFASPNVHNNGSARTINSANLAPSVAISVALDK